MSKKIYLAASACVATLMMASATVAAPLTTIYGEFSDTTTVITTGDNAPTVQNNPSSFTVTNGASPQTLMTVDPASCISPTSCGSGTDTVNVNVTLDFYSSSTHNAGTFLGSLTDIGQANFFYTGNNSGTDNICWLGGASVGGSALVTSSTIGSCATGSEQIVVSLGGTAYDVTLNDWHDWDETPQFSISTCYTNCSAGPHNNPVPEPLTLSLFGAGLAGAAALRRRKKKAA